MFTEIPAHAPRWTEHQTRRSTILLGVAALVVMVLLAASLAVDRLRVANRDQFEQLDTFHLRLDDAFGLLRDMETGQRGFLLTGDPAFLEPYNRAITDYPGVIAELQTLATSLGGDAPRLLANFEEAASTWQQQIQAEISEQRANPQTEYSTAQATADKQRFDAIRTRQRAITEFVEEGRDSLQRAHRWLVNTSLALLGIGTAATLGALLFGISLVRRIGLLASAQQTRQDRQEAYGQVISALNGPTQLQPLLTQSLPVLLDSVGAQAGVVYSVDRDLLRPEAAVGLHLADLPPLRTDEGVPGRAVQAQRAVVVNDLPSDTPYRIDTGIGAAPPRSLACVPLRYGRQMLGVLVTASVGQMNESEIDQLNLTASQLATAISTVRAFEETQQIASQLSQNNEYLARLLESSDTLQDIGRELVVQSDLQTLLNLVCREVRRLLRADYAAVATLADPLGSSRWAAIDGAASTSFRDTIFAPHKGTAGRVIDTAGPVVIHNFGDNPEFPPDEFPLHVAEGMKSSLGVPLFRKETPIGALIVGYRSEHPISDAEVELATALASYASIAIENARLVAELQQERDLAEQRAQELLVKNKEVERANKLKSEFVANMSHELRTPLNSILALSQILLDRLDGDLNEEQDKQVHIIERNGQNLLRLINDILDLSKIEAGRIDVMATQFRLVDVIDNVRTTIAPLVADKGLHFTVELAPDLPICYTDDNKLKQVLLNLCSNAVKFTERGSVTIRARRGRDVTVPDADPTTNWLTVEVQDTGIGIAPDDQTAVWEEFRQIDGSLSRQYEGTGLGLAIVRRLVRLLGGEIELDSAVGEGSTFRFAIPARLQTARRTDQSASETAAVSAMTQPSRSDSGLVPVTSASVRPLVLIVDDDVEVIYILEKYLRDEGYDIVAAHNGEDAIRKARELHPFAMTLDVMLPNRDGWDVIQELKSDPQTSDIHIIMLSMLDNRQLGYSLGATDYLVKPVSRTDLLRRLTQIRNGTPLRAVAVVDDDPIEARVLATALRDEGLEVTTFTNGPDALQWLTDHTPDLITLDLMMPGMDGFQVLDALRSQEHLRAVQVLIITAKDILPEDRTRLNGRIASIIQKGPRQRSDLLYEVRETLSQRRRPGVGSTINSSGGS